MNTLTDTPALTSVADVAGLLITHLQAHRLPEPASVRLCGGYPRITQPPELQVQADRRDTPGAARLLLAWVDTLPAVAASMWRVPRGETVHIEITGSLDAAGGPVDLCVYAGVTYDPAVLPTLGPGDTLPITLGLLRDLAVLDTAGGKAA